MKSINGSVFSLRLESSWLLASWRPLESNSQRNPSKLESRRLPRHSISTRCPVLAAKTNKSTSSDGRLRPLITEPKSMRIACGRHVVRLVLDHFRQIGDGKRSWVGDPSLVTSRTS